MRPDEELKELLNQGETLAVLNSGLGSAQKREMTVDVFSWFGGIGMILAEKWNSKRYTVRGQELYEDLLRRESHEIRPAEWESALATYYMPPSPGEDKVFRFLLRTAVPDRYIVNWAELDRFWSSGLVDAMMFLYGRLGGSKDLRRPSGRDEEAWCQWLSTQSKSDNNSAQQFGGMASTLGGQTGPTAEEQFQMEVLHKNTSGPYALVQDSDHLYWLDGYTLLAASKISKQVRAISKSRSSVDWSLLERGGYIYKIDRGGITRLPVAGGPEEVVYDRRSGRTTPDAGGFSDVPYFADVMTVSPSGAVMWLTSQDSGGLLQVRSNNTGKISTLASGERTSNFGHMIADNHNVYWIEPQTGSLKTVPIQGGQVTLISSGCADTTHFVQDAEYIYFTTPEGLMRSSKVGLDILFVTKLPSISALAVDESHVYYASWSERTTATGFIRRVPRRGGASEIIVTGLKTPNSLAIDSDYVYFADDQDQVVARVPRRGVGK
jgi:hypothetical protein